MVLPTLVAREEDTSLAYSFGGGSGRNLVGGYFFKFILDYIGGGGSCPPFPFILLTSLPQADLQSLLFFEGGNG